MRKRGGRRTRGGGLSNKSRAREISCSSVELSMARVVRSKNSGTLFQNAFSVRFILVGSQQMTSTDYGTRDGRPLARGGTTMTRCVGLAPSILSSILQDDNISHSG